jgi:putative hemolysin
MKYLTWIVALALVALGGWWLWQGQGAAPGGENQVGIANPASVYCVAQGGTLEIASGEGGEIGYCHLPDGSVCEEWAFMRGECGQAAAGNEVSCTESDAYFVVEKSRAPEVGSDILVKRKASASEDIACAYAPTEGDYVLSGLDATYVEVLEGEFLILDSGTAPDPRGLSVYDLSKEREIYTDRYSKPIELKNGTFTYWQPVDTVPTVQNCPELANWQASGLGAGIERHVSLNLATLKVTPLGETRCSARQ